MLRSVVIEPNMEPDFRGFGPYEIKFATDKCRIRKRQVQEEFRARGVLFTPFEYSQSLHDSELENRLAHYQSDVDTVNIKMKKKKEAEIKMSNTTNRISSHHKPSRVIKPNKRFQDFFADSKNEFKPKKRKKIIGNKQRKNAMISTEKTDGVHKIICEVCGAVRFYKYLKQARKFKVFSCEPCRKFITRTVNDSSLSMMICKSGKGNCIIPCYVNDPTTGYRGNTSRCKACWLLICLTRFHMPDALKTRLRLRLPNFMRKNSVAYPTPDLNYTDLTSVVHTSTPKYRRHSTGLKPIVFANCSEGEENDDGKPDMDPLACSDFLDQSSKDPLSISDPIKTEDFESG